MTYNEKPMMGVAYVFPIISLFLVPIVFMILGIVFGAINVARGYNGHGIAQIILSCVFGIIGTVFGFYTGAALFS